MRAFSEALYSICIFILTKQEVVAAVRDASRAWVWCPDNSHSQPIVQPLLYICKTRLTRISRRLEIPVPVILQKKQDGGCCLVVKCLHEKNVLKKKRIRNKVFCLKQQHADKVEKKKKKRDQQAVTLTISQNGLVLDIYWKANTQHIWQFLVLLGHLARLLQKGKKCSWSFRVSNSSTPSPSASPNPILQCISEPPPPFQVLLMDPTLSHPPPLLYHRLLNMTSFR